jgi:hypothetical protein
VRRRLGRPRPRQRRGPNTSKPAARTQKTVQIPSPIGSTLAAARLSARLTCPLTVSGHTPWQQIRHKARERGREWTVEIESGPGAGADEDALVRFHDVLRNDGRMLGPAAALKRDSGVLSAIFQVRAKDAGEAASTAVACFVSALATVSEGSTIPLGRLELELHDVELAPDPARSAGA